MKTRVEQVIAKLNEAHRQMCAAVQRQWDGQATFKMSIPARPADDTDLIITDAIEEAMAALAACGTPQQEDEKEE